MKYFNIVRKFPNTKLNCLFHVISVDIYYCQNKKNFIKINEQFSNVGAFCDNETEGNGLLRLNHFSVKH